MEGALNAVLKEFGGELTEKLRAIVEGEVAARTAELDRREQDLNARSSDLAAREKAIECREAVELAGPLPPSSQGAGEAATAGVAAKVAKPSAPSPADAPTPSRARNGAGLASSGLPRRPSHFDGARNEGQGSSRESPCPSVVPMSPPETASAGAASQLKDLFEKKAMSAARDASPIQRRHSWRPVLNELPKPDGSSTDKYRAHESPYKRVSSGPLVPVGTPPHRRTLEDLLKADEEYQRAC
mmetsp:Transcript_87756/g.212913  ORF Transcript_87756/g.212913 Transcript_87756/m.212913 type:complete len:242 (-) Transcript_87756:390-1115(-)